MKKRIFTPRRFVITTLIVFFFMFGYDIFYFVYNYGNFLTDLIYISVSVSYFVINIAFSIKNYKILKNIEKLHTLSAFTSFIMVIILSFGMVQDEFFSFYLLLYLFPIITIILSIYLLTNKRLLK
jgi:hypothetical protein